MDGLELLFTRNSISSTATKISHGGSNRAHAHCLLIGPTRVWSNDSQQIFLRLISHLKLSRWSVLLCETHFFVTLVVTSLSWRKSQNWCYHFVWYQQTGFLFPVLLTRKGSRFEQNKQKSYTSHVYCIKLNNTSNMGGNSPRRTSDLTKPPLKQQQSMCSAFPVHIRIHK